MGFFTKNSTRKISSNPANTAQLAQGNATRSAFPPKQTRRSNNNSLLRARDSRGKGSQGPQQKLTTDPKLLARAIAEGKAKADKAQAKEDAKKRSESREPRAQMREVLTPQQQQLIQSNPLAAGTEPTSYPYQTTGEAAATVQAAQPNPFGPRRSVSPQAATKAISEQFQTTGKKSVASVLAPATAARNAAAKRNGVLPPVPLTTKAVPITKNNSLANAGLQRNPALNRAIGSAQVSGLLGQQGGKRKTRRLHKSKARSRGRK